MKVEKYKAACEITVERRTRFRIIRVPQYTWHWMSWPHGYYSWFAFWGAREWLCYLWCFVTSLTSSNNPRDITFNKTASFNVLSNSLFTIILPFGAISWPKHTTTRQSFNSRRDFFGERQETKRIHESKCWQISIRRNPRGYLKSVCCLQWWIAVKKTSRNMEMKLSSINNKHEKRITA
jgi:hypothetical protein